MYLIPSAVGGLSALVQPWATLYSNHPWLQTTVIFTHLAGMFLGGGFAVATDRDTFLAHRASRLSGQIRQLSRIETIHLPVMVGLILALGSGALLALADWEHFAGSPVFWVKMSLLAVLLTNGYLLKRTETALRAGYEPNDPTLWARLRAISIASIIMWLILILLGAILANG